MPMLQINTNVPKEKITEEFNLNLCDVLAQTLSKPKGYCAVHILAGKTANKKMIILHIKLQNYLFFLKTN